MDIMSQYKKLVEFLGNVISSNYEIALLDLRDGYNKITAIANSNTGRTVGAPITNLALSIVKDEVWKTKNYLLNYSGMSIDNKPLVSSSFFIKQDGALLGMLCINVDISIYTNISNAILKLANVTYDSRKIEVDVPEGCTENFVNDINDIITTALNKITSHNNIPSNRLTKEEKINLVAELNENGIFLIKGAVTEVASHIDCSEATIYRYLSKINKK